MLVALSVDNKLGFVDGSIASIFYSLDLMFPSWKHCNDMVVSWLLNFVSIKMASNILYINAVRALWLELKEKFKVMVLGSMNFVMKLLLFFKGKIW